MVLILYLQNLLYYAVPRLILSQNKNRTEKSNNLHILKDGGRVINFFRADIRPSKEYILVRIKFLSYYIPFQGFVELYHPNRKVVPIKKFLFWYCIICQKNSS